MIIISIRLKKNKKKKKKNKIKKAIDVNKFNESIIKEETKINKELFNKHFHYQTPSALLKDLYKTNDQEKNRVLVNVINSGIQELNKEIETMSKDEKETEKPDKISKIVEEILKFNKQQQQSGKGLKILTPNQMLSRLPISLAQLKAGNNSEKLKNEIRQLLHSLYRSKNMTKQVCNSLINYI